MQHGSGWRALLLCERNPLSFRFLRIHQAYIRLTERFTEISHCDSPNSPTARQVTGTTFIASKCSVTDGFGCRQTVERSTVLGVRLVD
jgi:hypothetical protein